MKDDRTTVFAAIRASLGRGPLTSAPVRPAITPAPAIGRCGLAERVSQMRTKLISQAATVALAPSMDNVPGLVTEYLTGIDAQMTARVAAHPDLQALDWAKRAARLNVSYGASDIDDLVGISRGFAGMAETGTLVLLSGADCPITICFVPETHIVIIQGSEILAGFEGVWESIRKAREGAAFPRSVNFVSGPSRTADIEQTLQLGAHGPLRLHVIIIEDNGSADPSQT